MGRERAAVDLDGILHQLGARGAFGLRNYCLIIFPIMFSAIYNGQYVFTAARPNYRCKVPECEQSPPEWAGGPWAQWALPGGDRATCERHEPIAGAATCTQDAFLPTTQRCDSWVYETNYSIVAEFDLGCSEWQRTLVGSVHSAGLFTALLFVGFVSDTIGRRHTFIATASAPALVGLARSYVTGYRSYLALEFIEAFVGSGSYTTGYILAVEMVALDRRVLAGSGLAMFFAIGQVLLALAAWLFPYWRTLTRVLYLPSLAFLLYYFCLVESSRWLLSKGRKKEAADIILKAAAANGKQLSEESIRQLAEESEKYRNIQNDEIPVQSLLSQVLKSRVLMTRLLIACFWFITITFTYYGLSINSVSLAGNMYLNYGLTALAEVPGYVISVMTLDRFGRKSSIIAAFFVCGVALITMPFVPSTSASVQLGLSLVGKFAASMAISGIYVYALEMFPTSTRHALLAVCCLCGRVGLLLAPYSPLLIQVFPSLPYLVFGILAWSAGALMLLTPETLHSLLPDTVQQAEMITGKKHSSQIP